MFARAGNRTLTLDEVRSTAAQVGKLLDGLPPRVMLQILGAAGVIEVLDKHGLLAGLGTPQANGEVAQNALADRQRVLDDLRRRAEQGNVQAAKVYLTETRDIEERSLFARPVRLVITPYTLEDEVRVAARNLNAQRGEDIETWLEPTSPQRSR